MSREMKDSGIEWIGEIPIQWHSKKLKNIYQFEKGKEAAKYTKEFVANNKGIYPVYSGQTENDGVMGFINTFDYQEQECLFTTTVGAKVMTLKILKDKFSLSQNCLIMKKINNDENNLFMYYFLQSLFDYQKSTIPTHMQPSLRISDLNRFQVYLPSDIEQVNISNYLDTMIKSIDTNILKQTQLIEEYKNYKQALITETVTKGLNPNVEMKDSGSLYGLIPKNWDIKGLRFLGRVSNGLNKSATEFGFGYPFVSYGDVYKNLSLPTEVVGLVNTTEVDRESCSVRKGDVFFTRTSETIEEVGFASTCLETIENATFAGFLIRFRPTTDELDENYSKYYFRSDMHRRFFVKEMNIVTRASLSQELLKKLPVILPPKEEQVEIANYLDEKCSLMDNIIEQKQRLIEELEAYKKSLIYECVTGKREIPDTYDQSVDELVQAALDEVAVIEE